MTGKGRPVAIRRMQAADVGQVMAIADGLKEAPHWRRNVYLDALNPGTAPTRIALVAETPEAGVVGFAVTVLIPPQAELETMAVKAEAQRQGIASRLFSEMIAELKKIRITEVMLEVRESNRAALALYHAVGFMETGRRRAYYADPQEDALLLRQSIVCGQGPSPGCIAGET
jgi:ribosomal-protein-alanine N-acetyltransferase